MNKINPEMFIVPIIALVFSLCAFLFFKKKTSEKSAYNHLITYILLFGFVSNLAWELLHIPLYNIGGSNQNHVFLCALASVADAIMVVVLFFIITLFHKDYKWFTKLTFFKIIAVLTIGAFGAALSEKWHLYMGNWKYSALMPIIPLIKVGLSPVLQFTLLPIVIYYISGRIVFKNKLKEQRGFKKLDSIT